jgi:hypothetical protein
MSTSKSSIISTGPQALSIVFVLLHGCECREQSSLCPPETTATVVEGRTLCVVPMKRWDADGAASLDAGPDLDAAFDAE